MRQPGSILAAVAAITGAALGWPAPEAAAQQSLPGTVQESLPLDAFEQRVRDYLLKNPEVIVDALRLLEARQRAADAANLKKTINARRDEIFDSPDDPVGGNPAGDVTLVEFFDYNCPYCRRVAPTVAELEDTDPGLRLIYKEFPILGEGSAFAARAALAARKQGRYAAFHTALMQVKSKVNEATVMAAAETVGLDVERLRRDMQAPEIRAAIERNQRLARALGITGTPSFVVGEELVPGAVGLESLQGLIARTREEQG